MDRRTVSTESKMIWLSIISKLRKRALEFLHESKSGLLTDEERELAKERYEYLSLEIDRLAEKFPGE